MKRHALFVGVNDYADTTFKNLRYSLSDAVALSGAFAARGFDVEVLSNPKADAVLGAVERKSSGLGPGDVFLFFFAGNGFTAPDGSHLLICSNDRLAYLRHNRAGIPVDLLEEITNGRGCNRAFLLDACRTDVFAGVENRGAETRDLALVSLPDAKVHAGTCCVLRSCDRFCPAMEFDDLGHGVFTRAVMDVINDDSFCATPFGEKFVAGIRSRMHGILAAHSVVGAQNPCFQTNGESFFLFDVTASNRETPPSPPTATVFAAPTLVTCPVCGKKNDPRDTFTCRECGQDNLCLDHRDGRTFLCGACMRKEEERRRVAGERLVVRAGTVEVPLRWCPAGRFTMGSPQGEEGRYGDETQHRVTLTKGFWMGETAVTQGLWKEVMGGETVVDLARKALLDDTKYKINGKMQTIREWWGVSRDADPASQCVDLDDTVPVYHVSWHDAADFCVRLTAMARRNGTLPEGCEFRLPTEAQWEYACRAGTETALPNGRDIRILGERNAPALDDIAWYGGNSSVGFEGRGWDTDGWKEKQYPGGLAAPRTVAMKHPNRWGLYDMIGNVWEWCADWYGDYSGDADDPTGPASGVLRVLRGGGWGDSARVCRSAYRSRGHPGPRRDDYGFRLCCSAGPRG